MLGVVVGGPQNLVIRSQYPPSHRWASLCSWHGAGNITRFISQHIQETEAIGDVCGERERIYYKDCLTQL